MPDLQTTTTGQPQVGTTDLLAELRRITREIFDLHKHPQMSASAQRHLDDARETMRLARVDHQFHSANVQVEARRQ